MAETFFEFRLGEIEDRIGRRGIAEQCGIDQSTIDRWLTRGREPLVSYAYAVALGTGYDIDDLLVAAKLPSEPRREPERQRRSPLYKDTQRTRFNRSARLLVDGSGCTQREIALDVGVDYSTFKTWLGSRREPRVCNAQKLAERFGVSVHAMCEGNVGTP